MNIRKNRDKILTKYYFDLVKPYNILMKKVTFVPNKGQKVMQAE